MVSRYPEIKKYIIQKIEEKEYLPEVMLPTEKEFTLLFNVSRMTVRRALDELIQDGILFRKRGSGVFLAKEKISRSINKISICHDSDIKKNFNKLSVKLIDFKIIENHYITNKYTDLKNEEIYQIKRVQLGDGQPIVYENIFLPKKYFPLLEKDNCTMSMGEIIKNYMIEDERIKENEVIVEANSATTKIATLLQISTGTPLLQINITAKSENGATLYCGLNSYAGDSYNYIGSLT